MAANLLACRRRGRRSRRAAFHRTHGRNARAPRNRAARSAAEDSFHHANPAACRRAAHAYASRYRGGGADRTDPFVATSARAVGYPTHLSVGFETSQAHRCQSFAPTIGLPLLNRTPGFPRVAASPCPRRAVSHSARSRGGQSKGGGGGESRSQLGFIRPARDPDRWPSRMAPQHPGGSTS